MGQHKITSAPTTETAKASGQFSFVFITYLIQHVNINTYTMHTI